LVYPKPGKKGQKFPPQIMQKEERVQGVAGKAAHTALVVSKNKNS